MVANPCSTFCFAVIVCKDNPTADIAFFSHIAITNIGKMTYFTLAFNDAVFYFDKIADFNFVINNAMRSYSCKWTYCDIIFYYAIFKMA